MRDSALSMQSKPWPCCTDYKSLEHISKIVNSINGNLEIG